MARRILWLLTAGVVSFIITSGITYGIAQVTGKCRVVFDPEKGWYWCDQFTCTGTCYLQASGPPWLVGCPCL